MSTTVELARQQWSDGYRRFEEVRAHPRRYRGLLEQVEAAIEQLRRKVGGVYTVAELAAAYQSADSWLLDAAAAAMADRTVAADAAFHLYARGARDYEP